MSSITRPGAGPSPTVTGGTGPDAVKDGGEAKTEAPKRGAVWPTDKFELAPSTGGVFDAPPTGGPTVTGEPGGTGEVKGTEQGDQGGSSGTGEAECKPDRMKDGEFKKAVQGPWWVIIDEDTKVENKEVLKNTRREGKAMILRPSCDPSAPGDKSK